MQLDIDYELAGAINGLNIEAKGKGLADTKTGRYEMGLDFPKIPMHWDPAFVILICCDLMLGVSAREEGDARNIHSLSDGDHTILERDASGFTASGRKVMRASASSYGFKEGNKLTNRSQLLDCWIRLELLEEVTKIKQPYFATMTPFGSDGILVTSSYSFETSHGNTYRGFTNYPYKLKNGRSVQQPQLLTVESVEFQKQVKRSGSGTFNFVMNSSVKPLSFA